MPCEPSYSHLAERQDGRGERRHELRLPGWRASSPRDPLDARAFEQMVAGLDAALWTFVGTVAERVQDAERRQEHGQRAFRSRHATPAGRTDAARPKRASVGRLDDRCGALCRTYGRAGGSRREFQEGFRHGELQPIRIANERAQERCACDQISGDSELAKVFSEDGQRNANSTVMRP